MQIELINTGSELLLGNTLNTQQQWLGNRFTQWGRPVNRIQMVPDDGSLLAATVADSLRRADLVVSTGGLGPTSDDRTRDEIARLLNRPLNHDPSVEQHILDLCKERGIRIPPNAMVQAQVPRDALVLLNQFGSAPGLILQTDPGQFRASPSWLVMLPGPPRELYPMFDNQVLPWLQKTFPDPHGFKSKTFRSTGIGESRVEELLLKPLKPLLDQGLDLGFCARTGEVDIRFGGRGPLSDQLFEQAETILQQCLGPYIFGREQERLEEVVIRRLAERQMKIVTAESCTGGLVVNRLTNVPGASEVVIGGLVTYSNDLKQQLLGVNAGTLEHHGAVSEETAREMATGARERYSADIAAAITGIAGPSGGTDEKPVGTVFLAVASEKGIEVAKRVNRFERETFKLVTSQQALEMVRRTIN